MSWWRGAGRRRAGEVEKTPPPCDFNARTAVFLVNGFNGLGLHTLLAVVRMFPKVYQNFVFLQSGCWTPAISKARRK